jgi:F0F1-type ATP synthase gamma subunit
LRPGHGVDLLCTVLQTLYNGMLENNCSEHASRMAAMENSTKSASEMLGALTLAYNR